LTSSLFLRTGTGRSRCQARRKQRPRRLSVELLEDRTLLSFLPQVTYPTGSYPAGVAVGDFARNGKLDLVVTNYQSDTLSVFLGNGDGTFQAATDYATGHHPGSVAVGDFDRDGTPDIVVANTEGSLTMFLGNGDGTFQPGVSYPLGGRARDLTVADFRHSGRLDIAVITEQGGATNLSVLLGNGDGTFAAPVSYRAGNDSWFPAVADFNRDGIPDLVVAGGGNNSVFVLLGNGDGTFQSAQRYDAGAAPRSVAVGDFDRDGIPDLVTANIFGNDVSVLRGNGDGTFQSPVHYQVGTNPLDVVVSDVNLDGRQDLVVSNITSNNVSILLGNGDGTFALAENDDVGRNPNHVALGDFARHGYPDIVVGNTASNDISVLINAVDWSESPGGGGGYGRPSPRRLPTAAGSLDPLALALALTTMPSLVSSGDLSTSPWRRLELANATSVGGGDNSGRWDGTDPVLLPPARGSNSADGRDHYADVSCGLGAFERTSARGRASAASADLANALLGYTDDYDGDGIPDSIRVSTR
jgi:hypothetical protein